MIIEAWNTILELAPWLLLGAAIAGVLHATLPPDFMRRQLRGGRGVLKAVALGVPLPLCSCGVIPVGLGLKKSGATSGPVVGFLISTPQTGVDSILVSASFLGWPFAILKVAAAFVTGILGGWIADSIDPAISETSSSEQCASATTNRAAAGFEHAMTLIRSIWGWLVVGILCSAAITAYLPQEALAGMSGYGGLGAMLVTLAIATPLYVCAVASVPIAAALVASGLPAGAALVFLMAGPATNVATLGAVYRTLGRKTLAVYLTTVVVGSVVCGLLFEYVIDSSQLPAGATHQHQQWWNLSAAVLLLGMLLWFAWQDGMRLLRRGKTAASIGAQPTLKIAVDGMTCSNCTAKLERELAADDRIASAIVTLRPGAVVVQGDVSADRVRELIKQAGFSAATDRLVSASHGE